METTISKSQLWTGRIMSGFIVLFMLMDASFKFMKPQAVITTTVNELGYAEHHILLLGLLALAPTVLYLIPKTSVLGAILLTAYFGGAVATHVRVGNPLFSHALFPVYAGILVWGGLWFRNAKLRQIFPLTN